ncbi:hypothetical protein SLA2020_378460 [Shorea laevis]
MADKAHVFVYVACSTVLNLCFILNLYVGGDWKLSWSKKAAAEAEAVAAFSCSGHGRAYLDGLVVNGKPICECNSCYGGPDCSLFLPACAANAASYVPHTTPPPPASLGFLFFSFCRFIAQTRTEDKQRLERKQQAREIQIKRGVGLCHYIWE